MSDPQSANRAADREAAEWHVRLGERPVSAATLQAFAAWRRTPANAEAYHRVETLWRKTGSLSSDPEIQALTQGTLRRTRPRLSHIWARRLAPVAMVLVPVLVAVLVIGLWLPSRDVYSTDVGGRRMVQLDDGSQVQLDTDTRLKVRFGEAGRRVILEQGQALFTVAHDPARPFSVAAGSTEITALGTIFDVRREAVGVRVTLVEGAVAVAVTEANSGEPRRWRLSPGQQLATSRPGPEPVAVDAAIATSWSRGRLVFREAPLREAVAEVNRYLPDKIILAPGPAGDVRVNGVFATGDRDAFVSAVSDLFGLTVQPQSDGGVRLTAPSTAQ